MKHPLCVLLACAAATALHEARAQQPEAVLRFDQARKEELADRAPDRAADSAVAAARVRPLVFKLNRRWVTEEQAYDAVTLWNVRRVKDRLRRKRPEKGCRREKVRLLKFFIERDGRKGARPHLLGNVAGYNWTTGRYDPKDAKWHETPLHIGAYTLRTEMDSLRRAGVDVTSFYVTPQEFIYTVPVGSTYLLDGVRVAPEIFRLIDGLTLRTLDIRDDAEGRPVVTGDTYPDRVPLVFLSGERAEIGTWMRLGEARAYEMDAGTPLHYYYMLPVEAVELYGPEGRFGAIHIDMVEEK